MRGCWPVVDKSTQPKEFRNQAFKWLEQLKKDGLLPVDVPLRRSYLDEGRGERYEKLLLMFSSMVMRAQLVKIGGRRFEECDDFTVPCANDIRKLSSTDRHEKKDRLIAAIDEHMSQFVKNNRTRQGNWLVHSTVAKSYEEERQFLVDDISRLKHTLNDLCGSEEGNDLVDYKESADKVVAEWSRLFEILNQPRVTEAFDSLEVLFNNRKDENIKIDADALLESLKMPDSIISTLQKENVSLQQPNGKTDLISVFKILQSAIEYPAKQIKMLEQKISTMECENLKFAEFRKRFSELENLCQQASVKCEIIHKDINDKLANCSVEMTSSTKFNVPPAMKVPAIEFLPTGVDEAVASETMQSNIVSTPLAAQKYLIDAQFSKDPTIKRFRELRLSSSARKSLQTSALNRQQNKNDSPSSLNDIKSKLEALKNPRRSSTDVDEKENADVGLCESPNFDEENEVLLADESMIIKCVVINTV